MPLRPTRCCACCCGRCAWALALLMAAWHTLPHIPESMSRKVKHSLNSSADASLLCVEVAWHFSATVTYASSSVKWSNSADFHKTSHCRASSIGCIAKENLKSVSNTSKAVA